MASRLQNTTRNSFFNCVNMFSQIALGLASRVVFIATLDKAYLSVSGLFGNILGVLSFSELGIGAAIGFSLYKPLAENDTEKIKSLMQLFKKAYGVIGITVAGIGCALIPLLPYLVKNETQLSMQKIVLYYVIFLFDCAIGYFFSYRTTLLTCDQKAYRITKINTVARYVITVLQIFVLVSMQNYVLYLFVDIGIRLMVQFYCLRVVGKLYPYLREKNVHPLPEGELRNIWKNVRALMIHSLGYISITQTDNIIISSFVGFDAVGNVSNYVMLTTYASNLVNTMLNAAVASFGNLVAQESRAVQMAVYKRFRLLSHWLNGWMALGFALLSTRMITLMFGMDFALVLPAVLLMALVLLLRGELNPMMSFREAAGLFDKDKYLALCESVLNLVVSIVAVQYLGIVGVYLGTAVSALFTLVMRWRVLYTAMFADKSSELLRGCAKYFLGTGVSFAVCALASATVFSSNNWSNFVGLLVLCVAVPNAVYFALFRGTDELNYFVQLAKKALHAFRKRLKKKP